MWASAGLPVFAPRVAVLGGLCACVIPICAQIVFLRENLIPGNNWSEGAQPVRTDWMYSTGALSEVGCIVGLIYQFDALIQKTGGLKFRVTS